MRASRPDKWSLPCCAIVGLVGLFGASSAVSADDLIPPAGFVGTPSTPCLLAKYGQGQPCAEPQLPDGGDVRQLIAARLSRARFFIETHELKRALTEADAAVELDEGNVSARHLAARLSMSLGDMARAEQEIAIALRQSPDDVDVRATNAVRLQSLSAPTEALRAFDDILAQHPDHAFSREARAKLLLTMGRARDAVADLDVLLADGHPKAVLWSLRATADLALNDPRRAVADYAKAMEDQPGSLILLTGRATAYELAGDDAGALRDLDTILGPIGDKPNYAIGGDQLAKYRTQRALLLVRLKRFADAASEMANALTAGGRPAILRTQVFLRQNGFPQIALDGRDSDALRTALQSCFGLNACFVRMSDEL
jgi:predicted Zn-dependent protease